jgi:hypothetical protein
MNFLAGIVTFYNELSVNVIENRSFLRKVGGSILLRGPQGAKFLRALCSLFQIVKCDRKSSVFTEGSRNLVRTG